MTLSKKLKRYKGWIAVVVIVAVAATAVVLLRGARQTTAATSYTTEAVATGTLSVTIDGTGNLAVRDEVDTYPSVSGDVSKIYVSEGDSVQKGDVLYKLAATSVDQAVASAKAAKQQASTSVSKAKLDLYRAEASLDALEEKSDEPSSTVSSSDISIAKKEVSIAKQGVTSAQTSYSAAAEEYDDALDELDELEVTAPCDGIVWTVNAEKGDAVTPEGGDSTSSGSSGSSAGGTTNTSSSSSSSGAPVTIARDGKMGVEMSVNEVDVTGLAVGQDASVEFDAVSDLSMTGTVDEVSSVGSIDSGVVTYSVWITLDGADERLRTGMSATATIVTAVERGVLLVSNSAVKTADDGSTYVQVLEQGAQAPTDVTVVTGLSNATQTVITSGVSEGASVVTKTTTATSDDSSSEESESSSGQGSGMGSMMMMGGGTPPSGGPPSGGAPGGQ